MPTVLAALFLQQFLCPRFVGKLRHFQRTARVSTFATISEESAACTDLNSRSAALPPSIKIKLPQESYSASGIVRALLPVVVAFASIERFIMHNLRT